MNGPEEADAAINKAIVNNTNVILGGVAACKAARRRDIPYTMLITSRESILLAAKEAKYVRHALRIEKAKRSMFNTVLDYAYEGIIVVDQDQAITEFKPRCRTFFRDTKN